MIDFNRGPMASAATMRAIGRHRVAGNAGHEIGFIRFVTGGMLEPKVEHVAKTGDCRGGIDSPKDVFRGIQRPVLVTPRRHAHAKPRAWHSEE